MKCFIFAADRTCMPFRIQFISIVAKEANFWTKNSVLYNAIKHVNIIISKLIYSCTMCSWHYIAIQEDIPAIFQSYFRFFSTCE